jgi:hypothetical protein
VERLGEVAERVPLVVQSICPFANRDGFAGETLRFGVLAAVGVDACSENDSECGSVS